MKIFLPPLIVVTMITPVISSYPASASSLNNALSIQQKTNINSASSQKRISKSAANTLSLKAEIDQLRRETEDLELYGNHLTSLTQSQQQEIASLNRQIDEINITRQGVVPLMYRMLDALKSHISQDMPIKPGQRLNRIEKLNNMMKRADITDAEKYRRILEAYQIELDYGLKSAIFQSTIGNGKQDRKVEVLHLGRISLVARSLNGTQFWAWDQKNRQWNPLESNVKTAIDNAFSIAAKQSAPELVTLPVSLVTGEEK